MLFRRQTLDGTRICSICVDQRRLVTRGDPPTSSAAPADLLGIPHCPVAARPRVAHSRNPSRMHTRRTCAVPRRLGSRAILLTSRFEPHFHEHSFRLLPSRPKSSQATQLARSGLDVQFSTIRKGSLLSVFRHPRRYTPSVRPTTAVCRPGSVPWQGARTSLSPRRPDRHAGCGTRPGDKGAPLAPPRCHTPLSCRK